MHAVHAVLDLLTHNYLRFVFSVKLKVKILWMQGDAELVLALEYNCLWNLRWTWPRLALVSGGRYSIRRAMLQVLRDSESTVTYHEIRWTRHTSRLINPLISKTWSLNVNWLRSPNLNASCENVCLKTPIFSKATIVCSSPTSVKQANNKDSLQYLHGIKLTYIKPVEKITVPSRSCVAYFLPKLSLVVQLSHHQGLLSAVFMQKHAFWQA